MAEETPLDAPLSDEQAAPGPATLGEAQLPLSLTSEPPIVKEYILTRREQKFAVLQYVDDNEVTETINYFLNFCRDMGWTIEIIQ